LLNCFFFCVFKFSASLLFRLTRLDILVLFIHTYM
jgi:hypothetical protein